MNNFHKAEMVIGAGLAALAVACGPAKAPKLSDYRDLSEIIQFRESRYFIDRDSAGRVTCLRPIQGSRAANIWSYASTENSACGDASYTIVLPSSVLDKVGKHADEHQRLLFELDSTIFSQLER